MDSLDFNRTGFPSINNPIISHDTSSVNVSMPPVHAIKNKSNFIGHEVEREVDSLQTTRADKFKVGWTPINKEKQGTHGRPKKSVQEARFNTATLTFSSPSKFAQPTHNSKRTWKRVAVETLNSSETKDGSLDLRGKRKRAESEENHSVTEGKKQKLEVSFNTQTAKVAQQPRRAQRVFQVGTLGGLGTFKQLMPWQRWLIKKSPF